MKKTNSQIKFSASSSDDTYVLNYLLKRVRGLSPSSMAPAFAAADDARDNDLV